MAIVTMEDVKGEFEGVGATGDDMHPVAIKFVGFSCELGADEAAECLIELLECFGRHAVPMYLEQAIRARDALIAAIGEAPTDAGVPRFDLVRHLRRQIAFSERTFGPGARTAMVCDHIRKELAEIEAEPGELGEWVDVILLALDGAWRTGAAPEQIAAAIVAKQNRNEARSWPDWRTQDPDKAIEHDRSAGVA